MAEPLIGIVMGSQSDWETMRAATEVLTALGVADPQPDRLDELLLRAALGQDAGLLPLHAPVGSLPDGVGAVLRFSTRPDARPDTNDTDREDQ